MTSEPDEFALEPAYEHLRGLIVDLRAASASGARRLLWADDSAVVGVSRDRSGRLEIFIIGDPLVASDRSIRDAMTHATWSTEGGAELAASRLLLPAAPHFDQVAAFICAELATNGIADDRASAFARTEPIIALALRRAQMGNAFLTGLAGELLFLRGLLAAAPSSAASDIVSSWKGAGRTTRDFQLGPVGVEVKTTTTNGSVHHVQGIGQVEVGSSVGDEVETHLYLLSVGITWHDAGVTFGDSLASLVEHILAMLAVTEDRELLREKLAAYGREANGPISMPAVEESPHYHRRFTTTFERLYDLADPAVLLPSRDALAVFKHLDVESLSFRIALPEQIDGDLNPVAGIGEGVQMVLREAGFVD